jgi:hypothetical protein
MQGLALSKMDEWIENKTSSFIMFRFKSELRTVHRRRIAFQADLLTAEFAFNMWMLYLDASHSCYILEASGSCVSAIFLHLLLLVCFQL